MTVGKLHVGKAGRQWVKAVLHDGAFDLAAELAYWFFLSLFPFFIILASLGGAIATLLGVENPTERLVSLLSTYMPAEATRLVRPEIERVVGRQATGALSIGLIAALWVTTSGASAIIRAMNRAYDVRETRPVWKRYALALGITLLSGLVLTVAFVLFVGGQVFGQQIAAALGLSGAYRQALAFANWALVFALLLPGSLFLYWAAPNIHLRLWWLVPGAVFFTVGWLIATYVFALYVASFGAYGATYGALGGVAVLLVWFYLTGLILLAGADLNSVIDAQVDPDGLQKERSKVGPGRPEVHEHLRTSGKW